MVAPPVFSYRPEIDGLRAIAVLSVLFYHAGYPFMPGGFAGVDVFFVISGYLICSLILVEMSEGRFSMLRFWERRARRIFPALIAMTLVTCALSLIILFPGDLMRLGAGMIGVSTFLSNFVFARHSVDYFDIASEYNPLIHTWSLGVEEQFYLLFPPLLFALYRWAPRLLVPTLVIALFASLAWAQAVVPGSNGAGFYYTHLRAWELLVGVLLAIIMHRWDVSAGRVAREIGTMSGLVLIFGSLFLLDSGAPFPGLAAVPVVAGTALVIALSNPETILGRALGCRPLVGIGLISYSLYLWHQPLLALARHLYIPDPDGLLVPAMLALSFPVAWLSWRFIEAPFRDRSKFRPLTIGILSVAGLGVTFLAGLTLYLTAGLPQRLSPEIRETLDVVAEPDTRTDQCEIANGTPDQIREVVARCYVAGKTVYLIGDSHADEIGLTLREAAEREGFTLITLVRNACPPVFGVHHRHDPEKCDAMRKAAVEIVRENPGPIVLSARWRIYSTGAPFDNREGGREMGPSLPMLGEEGSRVTDTIGRIEASIRSWSEVAPVVVVDQIPEAGWLVPRAMARRKQFGFGGGQPLSTSYALYREENAKVMAMFDRLEKSPRIDAVRTAQLVCSDETGRCLNELDGEALYHDDDHPSLLFSRMIVAQVLRSGILKNLVTERGNP